MTVRLITTTHTTTTHLGEMRVRQCGGDYTDYWVERAGRRIHGIAQTSSVVLDRGTAYLSKGCEIALPIPLLSQHKSGPIGEVVFVRQREQSLYVQAVIFDNEVGDLAWGLVSRGEVTAFSVLHQNAHLQGHIDGIYIYDTWKLGEVSLVRVPANPDCEGVEILHPGAMPEEFPGDRRSRGVKLICATTRTRDYSVSACDNPPKPRKRSVAIPRVVARSANIRP